MSLSPEQEKQFIESANIIARIQDPATRQMALELHTIHLVRNSAEFRDAIFGRIGASMEDARDELIGGVSLGTLMDAAGIAGEGIDTAAAIAKEAWGFSSSLFVEIDPNQRGGLYHFSAELAVAIAEKAQQARQQNLSSSVLDYLSQGKIGEAFTKMGEWASMYVTAFFNSSSIEGLTFDQALAVEKTRLECKSIAQGLSDTDVQFGNPPQTFRINNALAQYIGGLNEKGQLTGKPFFLAADSETAAAVEKVRLKENPTIVDYAGNAVDAFNTASDKTKIAVGVGTYIAASTFGPATIKLATKSGAAYLAYMGYGAFEEGRYWDASADAGMAALLIPRLRNAGFFVLKEAAAVLPEATMAVGHIVKDAVARSAPWVASTATKAASTVVASAAIKQALKLGAGLAFKFVPIAGWGLTIYDFASAGKEWIDNDRAAGDSLQGITPEMLYTTIERYVKENPEIAGEMGENGNQLTEHAKHIVKITVIEAKLAELDPYNIEKSDLINALQGTSYARLLDRSPSSDNAVILDNIKRMLAIQKQSLGASLYTFVYDWAVNLYVTEGISGTEVGKAMLAHIQEALETAKARMPEQRAPEEAPKISQAPVILGKAVCAAVLGVGTLPSREATSEEALSCPPGETPVWMVGDVPKFVLRAPA